MFFLRPGSGARPRAAPLPTPREGACRRGRALRWGEGPEL
jgi:hypothetical protein